MRGCRVRSLRSFFFVAALFSVAFFDGEAEAQPTGKLGPLGVFQETNYYVNAGGGDCPDEISASYDEPTGEYDLAHLGGDVWRGGDNFLYSFNRVRGNFSLTARVVDKFSPVQQGKVSLMVRQDDVANEDGQHVSRYSWIYSPNFDDDTERKLVWAWRDEHGVGGTSFNSHEAGGRDWTNGADMQAEGRTFPWMRIERLRNVVTGYGSFDGSDWTVIGCNVLGPCAVGTDMNPMPWVDDRGIPNMPNEVLAGLLICGSSADCLLKPGTAKFADVTFVGCPSGEPGCAPPPTSTRREPDG